MKKLLSILLSIAILTSVSTAAFAASFSDLPSDHWAAAYVDNLVSNGTINGFEDGTFRPNGTVTRAQFVKMIGNGPTRYSKDFADVPSTHWAYEHIMTSGLVSDQDTNFYPDIPITRGEVAVLLWQRAGAPKGITAPPVIHRQGDNADALSWVYTYGIMTGNDNINLRLDDTLTRAEASALIVRSREINANSAKKSFDSLVDDKVLETAYKAFNFVDKEYSADAKLTNGELAQAAAIILSGTNQPLYKGVVIEKNFEHKYSLSINVMCRYVVGEENDNAEYADKNVSVKDAIATLMFASKKASISDIAYDKNGDTYPGTQNEAAKKLDFLKCAYQNGIWVGTDLNSELTLRDFASLLVQFDGFSGFQYAEVISDKIIAANYKLSTDIANYPSNADQYARILAGIPNYVYETPYVNALKTPAEAFSYSNQLHDIFDTLMTDWCKKCADMGVTIKLIYNPVFLLQSTTGFTYRTLIEVVDKGNANTLADIVTCANETIGAAKLENGKSFYIDIDTGTLMKTDLRFYIKDATVTQVLN